MGFLRRVGEGAPEGIHDVVEDTGQVFLRGEGDIKVTSRRTGSRRTRRKQRLQSTATGSATVPASARRTWTVEPGVRYAGTARGDAGVHCGGVVHRRMHQASAFGHRNRSGADSRGRMPHARASRATGHKAVILINVLPSPEHGPGCTGWSSRVLDFELRVESESDSTTERQSKSDGRSHLATH